MTENERIKQALKGFNRETAITASGIVEAVDLSDATITVNIGEGQTMDDVRLTSTVSGDAGFYIVPAVGSFVLLLRIGRSDEFFMVACSEFDKVIFKGENRSLEINDSQIIFNNNALGSFIPDLTKLVNKINAIESAFNSLKSKYNTHTHAVATTGTATAQSGTAAATTSTESTTLQSTTINDVKDPNILN